MTRARSAMTAIGTVLGAFLLVSCTGPQSTGTRDYDGASRLRVAAAAEASGQTDVALSMYASAAAAEPGQADVQARFVAALIRSGNTAQAEQVLSRAIERRRDDPALLVQLGRLRLRSGAAAQALEVFTRLLAVAPRNVEALDGQAIALDLLGRYVEAERSHRAAFALAPDGVGIANNLAMSLLLAGRPEEAAAILEPLARLPTAPPRVIANLAIARAASGDSDGARSLLDEGSSSGSINTIVEALSGGATAGRS